VEHKGWPHVFIIARRDIAAGTELTIDYGEGCEKGI
jgi:SET domain-containing protein